jgi:hypothetical protein
MPPLVVRRRDGLRGSVNTYLPDFWLPDAGQWAEVKGFMWPDAFARTMDLAYGLARRGTDLVLLGHLPSVWESRWPCQLALADGELAAIPWEPFCEPDLRRAIRERYLSPRLLLEGFPTVIPEWSEPALEAARWYRFPHTDGPRDVSAGYGRRTPADRHASSATSSRASRLPRARAVS